MAGATGLEPATSSVTGQLFSNGINVRFDSVRGNSGSKDTRFNFARAKVETRNRVANTAV